MLLGDTHRADDQASASEAVSLCFLEPMRWMSPHPHDKDPTFSSVVIHARDSRPSSRHDAQLRTAPQSEAKPGLSEANLS